ncbi:MAG: LysM peptidoglycan-binding domain-containing protein [Micrococcales bacterium]|nr:LysM peptidoglycan-binding domain-containing protein [Micrococcales bacterium]
MSAAVAWEPSTGRGRAARAPRRHLVSVPTGSQAQQAARRGRLHITRAGRLAVTTLVAAALLAVATAAFAVGGPTVDHTITVRPGQTLSEIASVELPGLPVGDAVARIQIANDLPGAQISAGQSLDIPEVG